MNLLSSAISFCTAKIRMQFNETPLATGSSFFYEHAGRSFIVTNRHNLTGRHQETQEPLDKKNGGIPNRLHLSIPSSKVSGDTMLFGGETWKLELRWGDASKPPWLEHPVLGPNADVVAIDVHKHWPQLPRPPFCVNRAPHALDLMVRPASRVSVVGYPFGKTVGDYYPVWVSGSVASELSSDVDGKPAFYIDCRTNRGSSGSPVFAFVPGGLVEFQNAGISTRDGVFMQYNHTDKTTWGLVAVQAQRFLGIYSGRISDQADIGLVWREEVIRDVCGTAGG